ncbi:MAG: AAA domain-containing protein [Alphaproteobacteria bacterium]|nr:AAA domain-containing protein [Alphaproteobacteria bacterium]
MVEKLTSFDPHLNLERILGLARDGSASAHADQLEASLDEVISCFTAAARFLDLDLAAIFETHAIAMIDLNELSERAAEWAGNKDRFEDWARLAKADREARVYGRERIAHALARGDLDPKLALLEIETAFAEASWKNAIADDAGLASLDGDRQNVLVARFQTLEAQSRKEAIDRVRARHSAGIPRGAQGGMSVIRAEIGRKRGHMPLRKLMKVAGSTIQKIKPVFLMSPVSVAQFLPPGAIEFDLLLIDEASQLRPEDALGLIARCRQIVVVGDKKQLPPTSFFDRMITGDTETGDGEGEGEEDEMAARQMNGPAPVTDLESILSLCEARGLESQMLRWHYRSRHPSLIEVSNSEFYHRLVMPPAPVLERTEMGLKLRRVKGAYERGGRRTNEVEAQAIVEAVSTQARLAPGLSLGIVTFSSAQRDLISDILEMRRREDRVLDGFLSRTGQEEVFVKNLENVQGDERDVILISIGYGPREAGQPLDSMAFGPISAEGGERRLNVLFTRARVRCEVFVSFNPADINLDRAPGEGPRVLKRFLQYAETGQLKAHRSSGADFDSAFEAAVAEAIENLGYEVEPQVGSAGFRIDLAVRDKARAGRYLLAVECDGATYHSALWARERDRLRQQVLENLGWRFHRIWSTDWFYRRGEQIEKLRRVLAEASAKTGGEVLPQPSPTLVRSDGPKKAPPREASKASEKPVKWPRRDKPMKPRYDLVGADNLAQRLGPHPEEAHPSRVPQDDEGASRSEPFGSESGPEARPQGRRLRMAKG